ncbi:MAG: lipase family alpha/beta hydrolase [Sandaracinaceae bacterium]
MSEAKKRTVVSDVRGAARLAVEATTGVTDVVEAMHGTIQRTPLLLGSAPRDRTFGITRLVYWSVRGWARAIGVGLDLGLAPFEQLLPEIVDSPPARDAVLAALNGVYGDYLAETGNPLALPMTVRHASRPLDLDALPSAPLPDEADPRRLLLLVHGLCVDDRLWWKDGTDHGSVLASELGHLPLYLRYNSGRAIADSGRALAALLDRLVRAWPAPIDSITIVAHSMGGLVARSACHQAEAEGLPWLERLNAVVFLGTPHHGAPLSRAGHFVEGMLALTPYAAPIGRLGRRVSRGIQDLRDGRIAPQGGVVPLPDGVRCYAVAGSRSRSDVDPAGPLLGDGLVPVDSALGRHAKEERTLRFPSGHRWVARDVGHLGLLHRPEVRAQLRAWLATGA